MKIFVSKKGKYFGPIPQVYVGRPSPLGNPYSAKEHGLQVALELFEHSLKNLTPSQTKMLSFILMRAKNGGVVLTCWCKDEFSPSQSDHECHADIIKKYLYDNFKD